MNVAILNTNLAPGGKAATLAEVVAGLLGQGEHEATVYSLAEWDLPACDGITCYKHEKTIALTAELAKADALVLVSPVYNYDLNAAAKNLIELTGYSWKGKAIGLVCTAGAEKSYLSPLGFMNSLATDYRCLVSPRYVYVSRADFNPDNSLPVDGDIHRRLAFLAKELPILAEAAARIAAMER
ncbi:MAG: NAD(P)H-dependent oxidoreductase [Verrucomicrobiales bacterium]|nr:NAD(P)H-dependent oxidoreductase [Verrucomicrobiales bacterium]